MNNPRFCVIEGIRTRYFEAGEGDPLVLIHGGQFGDFYNAYHWNLNFDGLSRHFRVYAMDRLGQGYTDNPPRDAAYTMRATIDHLRYFLLDKEVRQAVLVGHSRGALPASRIALDDPEMVRALVVVDTNTLAPDHPSTPKNFYSSLERNPPLIPDEEFVRREPEANSYSNRHIRLDFIREMVAIARLEKTKEAREKMKYLRNRQFLPEVSRQKQEILNRVRDGHLTVPTQVVWGLNDPSAPIVLGYKLFECIGTAVPHARLHVFNGAGHYVFREHPEEFNDIVLTFVKSLRQ